MRRSPLAAALLLAVALPVHAVDLASLRGYWRGQLERHGSLSGFAFELVPGDSGRMLARISLPAIRGYDLDVGPARAVGDSVFAGPFAFQWDPAVQRLRGVLPRAVVPVYEIAVELSRGERLVPEPRPPIAAPVRQPAWTFDCRTPLWADLEAGDGLVFAGGDDGVLHALDTKHGRERWRFATGGRLRGRPVLERNALYLPSDDGWLYRLRPDHGTVKWKVRIEPDSVIRIPIDRPGSQYDFSSSTVTAGGGFLFIGTHAGHVLALDPETGRKIWDTPVGGAVLAAPGYQNGRVFAGSFDGHVYALDGADGHRLWARDTGAPVTETPAPEGDVVVIGSRSYDLFGLDVATGDIRWDRYVWFSWIESSARTGDGVAYVGSSDAARIYAIEAATGTQKWECDDHGISWGRPALTETRVYAAVRYSPSVEKHEGSLLAIDRESGDVAWRYPNDRPAGATHRGFAASPAVDGRHVYAGGLDGVVYAFDLRDPRPARVRQ